MGERVSKYAIIAGVLLLISGAIIGVMHLTPRKPGETILSVDEAIVVPPRWIEKRHKLIGGNFSLPHFVMVENASLPLSLKVFYITGHGPYIPAGVEAKDFVMKGILRELHDNKFSFCICTRTDHEIWQAGCSHETLVKAENVSMYSFKLPLTEEQAKGRFQLLISSPTRVNIAVSVDIVWTEEASRYWRSKRLALYIPSEFVGTEDLLIVGTARELKGRKFNLFIFDVLNYDNWAVLDEPYTPLVEMNNVTATAFSFILTKERAMSSLMTWKGEYLPLYLVIENLTELEELVDLSLEVRLIEDQEHL